LLSDKTEKGHPLDDDRKKAMWTELLDLHVKLPIPGRAVALRDTAFMLEHGSIRITCRGGSDGSEPRELTADEIRVIAGWKEAYEAAVPSGEAGLREVEASLAAQAESHQEELKEQLEDVKEKVGKDSMIFRALSECEMPAPDADEPPAKRLKKYRVLVRHAHNEIKELEARNKEENAQRLREIRAGTHVAATAAADLRKDIVGIDVKDPNLDAAAALDKLREYEENEQKMVKDLRKELRALERKQEKVKAKAAAKAAAPTVSPAAGSGQGGFRQLPKILAAHFAQST
jgi:hypothetical protein